VAHAPLLQPADPKPEAPLHPAAHKASATAAAEQSHSRVAEAVQVMEPKATRTAPAAVVPPKRHTARETGRPTATSAERARSSGGSGGGGGGGQEKPRSARDGGGGGVNTTTTTATAHARATPSPVPSQSSHSQLASEQQIAEAALRAVMNRRTYSSVRARASSHPNSSVCLRGFDGESLPSPPHSKPPFAPPLQCGASRSGGFSSVAACVCVLVWPVQGFSSPPGSVQEHLAMTLDGKR
jgi:hypothetical protein